MPALHGRRLCRHQPDRRPLLSVLRPESGDAMIRRMAGLAKRPRDVLGLALVAILVLTVLVGLVWTPYDPIAIDLAHPLQPPSLAHWLGTDQFGRDVLSRAMIGARLSMEIALETVTAAILCGAALGVLTGYLRGWTDR